MMNFEDKKGYKYLGGIHVHSKYSDGTGDIYAITRAAKKAGLDWIIVTDHNNFDIQEGIINGIYVIRGLEISPVNSNHYLALGIDKIIDYNQEPQKFVDEVREQGGVGFAAHPDESNNRKNKYSPIKWRDKAVVPDGIEIWNWFSVWADNYVDKNIFAQAYAFFFKHKLITKPQTETLSWWDGLNNKSNEIIPAIGSIDVHALKIDKYIFPVTIFPYKDMFKTITNVITLKKELSKDFLIAKKQILEAIRLGNNFIVNRKMTKVIPQVMISNSKETVYAGESIELDEDTYVRVKFGKEFEVRLICNGEVIWENKTKEAEIPLCKKGKFRVEAKLNKLGYAYSNPIVVR